MPAKPKVMSKQVKKNKAAIKKLNAVEPKFLVDNVALAPLVGNTTSVLLNAPVRGNSVNQREGILTKGVACNANIQIENRTNVPLFVRVMMFRYIPVNGIIFSAAELWSDNSTPVLSTNSLQDNGFKQKFKIYFDRNYTLSGNNNDNQNQSRTVKIRQQLSGLITHFLPFTDGGVASIVTNAIYLLVQHESGTAADLGFGYSTEYIYTDQ